jgi:hypothetical protein
VDGGIDGLVGNPVAGAGPVVEVGDVDGQVLGPAADVGEGEGAGVVEELLWGAGGGAGVLEEAAGGFQRAGAGRPPGQVGGWAESGGPVVSFGGWGEVLGVAAGVWMVRWWLPSSRRVAAMVQDPTRSQTACW